MSKRLLLIRNSTQHGSGYLDHCAAVIQDFLGRARGVAFVPYAMSDHGGYSRRTRERMSRLGFDCTSVHEAAAPVAAVRAADAVFIGGGNPFRLLDWIYRTGLLDAL